MDDPMRNPSFTSWMNGEEKKIRSEFMAKRKEISGDAFLFGFGDNGLKNDKATEISMSYDKSYQDEEIAVKTFRDNAIKHETERLELMEQSRKLANSLYRKRR